MDAVGRQLGWRNIVPDLAGSRSHADKIADKVVEPMLGTSNVWASMQKSRELVAVVLVGDIRVGLEDSVQSVDRATGAIPDFGEAVEVVGERLA